MSKRITKSTVLKLGCLMILALGASTLAADPGLEWADWTTYMMGVDADNLDAVKTALQGDP